MSITVPENLNTQLGSRSENWIVQLYNTDKSYCTTTTEAVAINETDIDVSSSSKLNVNDIISITSDTELLKITAINSNTITVQRRYLGTQTSAGDSLSANLSLYKRTYIGLSYSAITLEDHFYEPCILNKPSIRESINLENQTSARSNVSLKIANFTYQGAPFSEQLHNGSHTYLNQLVRIFIPIGGIKSTVKTKDCLQIYEGRLVSSSHNDQTISLEINTDAPWKDVTIPNVKHDTKDFYQPIVYGDYDSTTQGGDGVYGAVFPVEIIMAGNGLITTIMPKAYTNSNGAHLHHYGGFNWFIAMGAIGGVSLSATQNEDGINALKTPASHRAQGYIRLEDSTLEAGGSVTYMSDSLNAFTYNRSTGAYDNSVFATATMNSGTSPVYLVAQTPGKKFTSWFSMLALRYSITGQSHNQDYFIQAFSNQYDDLRDNLFTGSGLEVTLASNISAHTFTFNDEPNNAAKYDDDDDGDDDAQNGPVPPDDVLIKFDPSATEVGGHSNHTLKVYDVRLKLNTIFKASDDDYRQIIDHKYFYCGADGLHDTQVNGVYWIGGSIHSTNITKLPQMHRDLLHRYTYIENEPDNWTNLNSEHSWSGRLWQHTPTKLSELLQKLQSEGQFIFRLKNDNTPQYVFLRDYPQADHILTKQDIANFEVSDTDFRNISTKYVLNFRKHPAESGKYIEQTEVEDSTVRTLYNIQNTSDNTKTIDFDYLVDSVSGGSNINSSYHNYRKQLFGTVKTILKCKVVNPQFYSMDVGDIVALEDMHIKAYNVDYSNTAYMITSIQRKLGEMDIELQEVANGLLSNWTILTPSSVTEGQAKTVNMSNQHWKARTMNLELFRGSALIQTILSGADVAYTPTSVSAISWTPANIEGSHSDYTLKATCIETGSVSTSNNFSITPA
nr:hypothetical protein [uncultured Mediterranean phage uvMED]